MELKAESVNGLLRRVEPPPGVPAFLHARGGAVEPGQTFWTVTDGILREHLAEKFVRRLPEHCFDEPPWEILSGEFRVQPDRCYVNRLEALGHSAAVLGEWIGRDAETLSRHRAELARIDEQLRQETARDCC